MTGSDSALAYAEATFLAPGGLDREAVLRAAAAVAGRTSDIADLYVQSTTRSSWRLEDGRIVAGDFRVDRGMGARSVVGEAVAFANSQAVSPAGLADMTAAVRAIARHGDERRRPAGVALAPPPTPPNFVAAGAAGAVTPPPASIAEAGVPALWMACLHSAEAAARALDPRIVDVEARIEGIDDVVMIADADGRIAGDRRPSLKLSIRVIALAGDRRTAGRATCGLRTGIDSLSPAAIAACAARAVRIAVTNLDARPAPAGAMSVVLGPGYPGVLFHEAVGHGLEADHHRKSLSPFADRFGTRIAAPGVAVIDDGSLPDRLGSSAIDDEGTPTARTVLVEDGILTGLLSDRLNARLMNAASTGNGRRQSYAHLPMPRMTNTFLAAGDADPAEILSSVRDGIYATEFGGGQVDIVSGRFNFTTQLAWRIEDGRITAPITGATLIGVGHEALRHIAMVGNDIELDQGEAICGKQGQTVDVSVGQPTIRIDAMTVGGG